jgi:DNA-binding transcriptional MerR regulator
MNDEVEFPWEESATEDAGGSAPVADAPPAPDATPHADATPHGDATPHADAPPAPDATPAPRDPTRGRKIARKEYYSIGEVSDLVGLPAHVLRYWESQFPVLNPSKNRSGNRAYQRKEIRLILLVKQLLYEDKYTVEGAKTKLDQLRKGGDLAGASAGALDKELMELLRQDVAELRRVLAGSRA